MELAFSESIANKRTKTNSLQHCKSQVLDKKMEVKSSYSKMNIQNYENWFTN